MLRKLLLVEDEEHLRNHMVKDVSWNEMGIGQVVGAATGEEALRLVHDFQPDILLTDIRMPGMTGIELARTLLQRWPQLRVIFMSAYSDVDYLHSALRMGSVDYLFKPVQLDDLKSALSLALASLQELRHAQTHTQIAEHYGDQLIQPILSHLLEGDSPMEQLLGQMDALPTWRGDGFYLAVMLHPLALLHRDTYEACVRCLALPGFAYARQVPLQEDRQIIFLCYEAAPSSANLEGVLRQVGTQLLSRGLPHVQVTCSTYEGTLQSLYGFARREQSAAAAGMQRPRVSALCEKMTELIHQRYPDHAFGAGAIAQELHYTNAYVCTVFKQKYGITIHDYINMVRIARAKELLEGTNDSLSSIAERVGYENDSYFSRVFKKSEGISPSDFRRRHRT